MGLPVTVYRWDDVGAPQLSEGKPSEFINIIEKCLVSGYGSKLPLGWTLAFSSATAKMFKNATTDGGIGGYVKLERTGDDATYSTIKITGCVSATSITAMTNQGFYFTIYTEPDVLKWVVIGTKHGFYFITGRTVVEFGTYYCPSFFAGQVESIYPNDVNNFIATTFCNSSDSDSASWTTSLPFGLFGVDTPIQKLYQTITGAKNTTHKLRLPFYPSQSAGQVAPVTVNVVYSKIPIVTSPDYQYDDVGADPDRDSANIPYHRSTRMPIVRGFVTGMLMRSVGGDSQATWPATLAIDGVQHFGIASANGGGQQFFINMETW